MDPHAPKPTRPPSTGAMPVQPGKAVATPRPKAPVKPGTTGMKVPPAQPPSRRVIPAPPPPEEEGPVIVSSGGEEVSHVRRQVAPPRHAPPGLSLRWKIMIAMASITVATAALIFVVVYSKAVTQLDAEIDVKGVRLVKMLSTIDAAYWRAAIGTGEEKRRKKADEVLRRIDPEFTEQRLQANADLKAIHDYLLNPLGALTPLKSTQGDIGTAASDIMQISVLDPYAREGGSVQAVDDFGVRGISLTNKRADPSGVSISDGRDKATDTEIRSFILEKDHAGGGKLRYTVILSLAHIDAAKDSLRTIILLPIALAMVLGIGVAFWISTAITGPIQALMHDMDEVSNGNLDHQTRPRSKDEIGLLASTFNRMTTALRAAHEAELQSKALEHDLAIASEIQSNLVPKHMLQLPGCDISAYYRPSKEVGGDYYDFIEIDEDNQGIIVADVSGKGVPGSLVMTMARAFIRMEAERSRNTSPSDTLIRANRMLAQDIKKGMFVTALYCILNKKTGEIRVSSAGHNPLIVWRAATNKVELVNPNGIALGFDKGPVFERSIKEDRVVLGHGDRIVAYTDGTVEAMNADNEEFGDDKFQSLIKQLAPRDSNQMLNLLVKALDEHKGSAPQSDDITIVTLRYL